MGAVSLAAWERFYDRVVTHGSEWPRALWFAAVEDGLKGVLPENSRLLGEYRRYVAELKKLQHDATGSHRDAQLVAQLEADIMRLIGHTDRAIRERVAGPDQRVRRVGSPPQRREEGGIWRAALTAGVMLFCAVLLGATYYQNERMIKRMEGELAAFQQRLSEQAAAQRATLEDRISTVDRVKQDLEGLQTELQANVAEFNQVMSSSVQSMTALSDGAIDELERRLAERNGNLETALAGLRERAATLGRGFAQVDERFATLAGRLPDLDSGVDRLAEQLRTTEADFERAAGQVATIKTQAPEIALWLEGQRQGLAQTLEGQRQTLDELDFEIGTLKGAMNESRGELVTFQGTLEQDLKRASQQSDALAGTLDDLRATEAQAKELLSEIDTQIQTTEGELQKRIDVILADLTEKANLAARSSDDAIKRAEVEAVRGLETATAQAIESLTEAREQRLTELGRWAEAAQAELARTYAGLVAGWRGLDEAVAGRQSQVLASLDRYAATLEGRVRELLDALEVIGVRSNG